MSQANAEHQLLAAKVKLAEGSHRDVLELLDAIIAESAEEEAHKLLLAGQSFEGLNDVPRAIEAYTRAQSLAPELAVPLLRRGALSYHAGDREAARRLLLRYVELEPGNPEAYYYLALCEPIPLRRSAFVSTVAILDGPAAAWSSELLRHLTR
jgi:tetratricopeptide (TPR) repeat protein